MKHILFVDDEENILTGLRRMLRPLRDEWDMHFVSSGTAALETLAKLPFDIVISDMQMPGMTGDILLQHVQNKYPNTIRMILSGQASEESVIKAIGPTHQYMAKPFDAEKIQNTIARALRLRETLQGNILSDIIPQIDSLPSIPAVYQKVMEEVQSPNPSIQRLSELISKDLGMASKILQLVNSAFFGVMRHIVDVHAAINLLGLERIKQLILGVHIFNKFEQKSIQDFSIDGLWRHSMASSELAKILATETGHSSIIDQHAISALLHDIGILILASNLPKQYEFILKEAKETNIPLDEVERRHLNISHAEIGAYLLGIWGMPDPIVEAVAFHHQPLDSLNHTISPLTTTHIANAFEHALSLGSQEIIPNTINHAYLSSLGLEENLVELWTKCYNARIQYPPGS